MNDEIVILKRRIELKEQLIDLTKDEIFYLLQKIVRLDSQETTKDKE